MPPENNYHQALDPAQLQVSYPDRYLLHQMPHQPNFYGRETEISDLKTWILKQQCHLVLITGIGGQGKTALTTHFCQQAALLNHFDKIIWQSLVNTPSLATVVERLLRFFLKQEPSRIPENFHSQLHLLFEQFQQQRCLLILDNMESILNGSGQRYQTGYKNYGDFLRQAGQSPMHSCLLLTSRQIPPEMPRLLHTSPQVKVLSLTGVDQATGKRMLEARHISIFDKQAQALLQRYSGNPLALELTADTIQSQFAGNVSAFLASEVSVNGQIQDLLDQQIARLSSVEEGILIWLAIERETIDRQTLQNNMYDQHNQRAILEALNTLKQCTLLRITLNGFGLQNMVMEYLSERLIAKVCQEIITTEFDYFQRFTLLKAQTKAYIRQTHARIFLRTVTKRLIDQLGLAGLEHQLRAQLITLQGQGLRKDGYAAGNILNLLLYLGIDVSGLDLSNLTIWQAYLQDAILPNVNFSGADLTDSVFMNALFQTMSIVFSPDGQYLATAHSQEEINIWQVEDLVISKTFRRGNPSEICVIFSPDGRWLAANGADNAIYVWDHQSNAAPLILTGHTSSIPKLCFSPDSQLLASASLDETVRLWDIYTGEEVAKFEGHNGLVYGVAFVPNTDWLISTGADGQIFAWSVVTKTHLHSCQGHERMHWGIAVSSDGNWLATAGTDGVIKLWMLPSLVVQQTLTGHEELVNVLTFSPDNKSLASLSGDGTIRLWDVAEGRLIRTMLTNTRDAYGLAFHPNGTQLASCDETYPIRLWDVQTGEMLYSTKSSRQNEPYQLLFSSDGQILVSAHINSDIRLWNLQQTPPTAMIQRAESKTSTRYMALSEDGTTLVCTYGPNFQVWAFPKMDLQHTVAIPAKRLTRIALSQNAQWVAVSASDYLVWLGDIDHPQLDLRLKGHTSQIIYLAFSPDNTVLVSASHDNTTKIWDTTTGSCLHTIQMPGETLYDVCFSPDSQYLISGHEKTICVWDVKTGEQVRQFTPHSVQNLRCPLAINKSGNIIASIAQDYSIILWDFRQGQVLRHLDGYNAYTAAITFNPEGTILASGSVDEMIRLWDVETGQCLSTLEAEVPYKGMNITDTVGLTPATKNTLKQLGAIDQV